MECRFLNPNFAIELPACSADRQNSHEVPPGAGLTPLTPKRCVAARRSDFFLSRHGGDNEKSGLNIQKQRNFNPTFNQQVQRQ